MDFRLGEYKYFDRDSGGFLTPLKGKLYKGFSKFTGRYICRFKRSRRRGYVGGLEKMLRESLPFHPTVESDGKKMRIWRWGETLNGISHGRSHSWLSGGEYINVNWRHGKMHGLWWEIKYSGLSEIRNFKDDVNHGLSRSFYPYLKIKNREIVRNNEQIVEDTFFDQDGNPCDPMTAYDESYFGDILDEDPYELFPHLRRWARKCSNIRQDNLEDYELEIPEGYDTTGFDLNPDLDK